MFYIYMLPLRNQDLQKQHIHSGSHYVNVTSTRIFTYTHSELIVYFMVLHLRHTHSSTTWWGILRYIVSFVGCSGFDDGTLPDFSGLPWHELVSDVFF